MSPVHLTCSLPKDGETPQLGALMLIIGEHQQRSLWGLFVLMLFPLRAMI